MHQEHQKSKEKLKRKIEPEQSATTSGRNWCGFLIERCAKL